MNKTSEIKFTVQLDDHHVPEKIRWTAEDGKEGGNCNAAMISIWDTKEEGLLKIDLWTKDMLVDDMKKLYHQMLLSMADSLERATGEQRVANDVREFSRYFAEELALIPKRAE